MCVYLTFVQQGKLAKKLSQVGILQFKPVVIVVVALYVSKN